MEAGTGKAKKPFYKTWWGITILVFGGLIVIGSLKNGGNGGGSGSGSGVGTVENDSVKIAKIMNKYRVFKKDDFSVIEREGIYGLSSVWSSNDGTSEALYNAHLEKKTVAFVGNISYSWLQYDFAYYSPNCGRDTHPYVSLHPLLSNKAVKEIGSHKVMLVGIIKEIKVKPAQSACETGKLEIELNLDAVYDLSTNKLVDN